MRNKAGTFRFDGRSEVNKCSLELGASLPICDRLTIAVCRIGDARIDGRLRRL